MTQFRGKFTQKLDKKARVSVPASFRARLAGEGLVLRRSTRHPCVEAWPASRFDDTVRSTGPLDELSEEDDFLAYAMFADVVDAAPDPEGRIVLPEELMAHAGLDEGVTFLGRLTHFELWEPAAAETQIEAARARLAARAQSRAQAGNPGTGDT